MISLLQQDIQEIAFKIAIESEELLIKKYKNYYELLKDKDLKALFQEFENTSRERIKIFLEKMEKLNPQGRLEK